MKRLRLLIILAIFFIPSIVFAENLTPKVDETQKIYDYADLLTDEEEKQLFELVDYYIDKYNQDMVVVTISENPYGVSDTYTMNYADDFYDYNNFGKGENKDGILILIDMANRYPWISTTGNAIILYDDARINQMHDLAFDYLKNGEYYNALKTYVETATALADYGIPESNQNVSYSDIVNTYCYSPSKGLYLCKSVEKKVNWIVSLITGIALAVIILLIHLGKYKGIRLAKNANTYLGSVERGPNVDQFLTTFTSKVRRSHDDSSSGGHSGGGHIGGSSFHVGGSGSFHGGGGGRHF